MSNEAQEPGGNIPYGPIRRTIAEDFGRRLQRHLLRKGWNQSDLARQASLHMPGNKKVGRDSVSHYVRGMNVPGPGVLAALAKALGVEPNELLPNMPTLKEDRETPLDATDAGNGKANLRVNMVVDWPIASQVIQILTNAA